MYVLVSWYYFALPWKSKKRGITYYLGISDKKGQMILHNSKQHENRCLKF